MIITLEACKPETYVGCPAPAVTPPTDCEAGYEIGNGTIVCASVPAQREPLAATGGDLALSLALIGIALALVSLGIALVGLVAIERAAKRRREAEAEYFTEAAAKLAAIRGSLER